MKPAALFALMMLPLSVSANSVLESFANLTAVSPAVAPTEGNSMIEGSNFLLTKFTSAGELVVSSEDAYGSAEDGNYLRWNSRTSDELRLVMTPPLDLRDEESNPAPLRMAFAFRADSLGSNDDSTISLLKIESPLSSTFGMEIADGKLATSAINNAPQTPLGAGPLSEETVGLWQVLAVEAQFGEAAENTYRIWLAPEGEKLRLIAIVNPPFPNFYSNPIVHTVSFFASTLPANQSGAEISLDELRFYDVSNVNNTDDFLNSIAQDYQVSLPDHIETWVVQ